jgi:hypothetical protein
MSQSARFLMAASLLPLACAPQAQAQAAPVVIAVEYRVASQSPEHIEESLVTPLERRLLRLPGMASLESGVTHGRARLEHWGPRTLDIDVLTYGDLVVEEPGLTIPHPRLQDRAFVLTPLAEIAPDTLVRGVRVEELCGLVDAQGVEKSDHL